MHFSSPAPLTLPADHVGLYIHIPFCVRKCRYCDFASGPLGDGSLADRYLDAMVQEARLRRAEVTRPLNSVFIGGGTPTALTGDQLRRVWHEVVAQYPLARQVEVSLEGNPGTLNADVLAALAELPLTRVSLGAQSLHADELALLGRIHTARDVEDGVAALRALGAPQVNLDLMYALPGQTAASWEMTLRRCLALRPDHLSLYALILEDGTPLAEQVRAGIVPEPDEDEEAAMTAVTAQLLAEAGYARYEVSNFALPGRHCRHNLGYWLGHDYLGLGVSAVSTIGNVRWRNTEEITAYLAQLSDARSALTYIERLSAPARLLERVMLGLRLTEGFHLVAAEAACGCTLRDVTGAELAALKAEGLVCGDGDTLRLTPIGYPIANTIMARLMAAADRNVAMGDSHG